MSCTQTKDEENNLSIINWTLSSVGGDVNYYSTGATTVIINGVRVYHSERVSWDAKKFPAKKGSESGTFAIDHNEDGNKTISVSLATAIYYTTVKTTAEEWVLDTIERGAKLTSAPNFTDEELPTITYTNPRGNGVDKIDACIADSVGWYAYAPYRDLSKTGTSYTFTNEDMAILKNKAGKNLTVMFILRTVVNGKTYTDFLVRTLTMTENEDTKPTVSMSLSPVNPPSIPNTLANAYIQGKTRVAVQVSASGKYNATISRYDVSCDGRAYQSSSNAITTDVLQHGSNVTCVVTDSRGFKQRAASGALSVLEYSKPLVIPIGGTNAIQCYRSDNNGNLVGSSTSVRIKAKRLYYGLNGNNKCALQWRSKPTSEAWNDNEHKWQDLIPKTTTNTDEYNSIVSGEFALGSSYSVQIRAIDDLGESDVKDIEIPTQDVALHLARGGRSVTIGEYCDYKESHTFNCAWKAIFKKGIHGALYPQEAGDVLAFALTCQRGLVPFYTTAESTNIPANGNYNFGVGFVLTRKDGERDNRQATVFLLETVNGAFAINNYHYESGGWLGWKYHTPHS